MKRKGVKLIMSEYADIVIGNLSLHWFRNYLDSKIVSLFFSKNDLIVVNNCNIDDDDKDAGTYTKYMYRTTVRRAKERLDAQGFGLNNFEKIFNDEMVQAVDYSSFLYHLQGDYDEEDKNNEIRIKKNVSLKKWKNAMKKIVSYELANGNIQFGGTLSEVNITTECDKVIFYSLKDEDSESFYALNPEIINYKYVYRLILEYCANDMEIILDFSNLDNWAVRMPSRRSSPAPARVKGVPAVSSFRKYRSANFASTASPAQRMSQPASAARTLPNSSTPVRMPWMVTPPQWMAPSLPKARLKMPRTQPQKPMTARSHSAMIP